MVESLASGALLPDDILSRLIMQEARKTEDEIAKSNAYNGCRRVSIVKIKPNYL